MTQAIRNVKYVNDGTGYKIETDDSITEEEKSAIKNSAFPQGKHWSQYAGTQSYKVFNLPSGLIAVSKILVTNGTDFGRPGVLQANIEILPRSNYWAYLQKLLTSILKENNLDDDQVESFSKQIWLDQIFGRQTVFTSSYKDPVHWAKLNASILKSILNLPKLWRKPIPFTTFALDLPVENQILGIPTSAAATDKRQGKSFISIDNE
jgi:hypothetical protein